MKELATSPLMGEIDKILGDEGRSEKYKVEAVFYVEKETITPLRVISLDLVRNYRENYADEVYLEVLMGSGSFYTLFIPNKDKIKCEILYTHIATRSVIVEEYEAIPVDYVVKTMESTDPRQTDRNTGDLFDQSNFKFQLKDTLTKEMELITIGGIWRSTTPGTLLKGLLDGYTKELEKGLEDAPRGVTMQPPDNNETRDHIGIRHGTPLVDLADILQQEHGGIYSNALGFYFQQGMWYVWSMYDKEQMQTAPKSVTLFMIPRAKLAGVSNTYRSTDDQLMVLVTGDRMHKDVRDKRLNEEGNAVRYVDSRKQLESFRTMEGESPVAMRGENASEYIGVERDNTTNHVQLAKSTDNPFHESSKMAARDGTHLVVQWENGDPNLIRPDMAIKVVYDLNQEVIEYGARVLEVHRLISSPSVGALNGVFSNMTLLHLFLDSDYKDWEQPPEHG